ncbi:unnamed protein product [Nesidiocoris tenuis]|uniref:Class II aldolase/adducin N-terminal domain-containing protein n=1 Tax=Nesidiocoris tenuis TaxID=355587 RepID=A0A6H5HLJ8_9HEMI|nr:unnamed protein product [Nesidiocoris tenuis]
MNGNGTEKAGQELQTHINDKEDPLVLIPELCKQFYHLGWVTGTGGGISIRQNEKIYIAPSGVQKERIESDDIFIQNIQGEDLLLPPAHKKLKKSQCTPLFMCCYTGNLLQFISEENVPIHKDRRSLETPVQHVQLHLDQSLHCYYAFLVHYFQK